MNLFSRLFGKNQKAQTLADPEPKQKKQPAQEKPATIEQQPPPPKKPDSPAAKKPEKPAAPRPKKPETAADAPLVKETAPWRTFSIFISSTFADMQAERDHLKNKVFPEVEEELQKRRIKLEIVDLRWGVDTISMKQEDEREANVLKVCLDEIKRCRPFFIGLLGERYGWVPHEKRMADAVVGEGLTAPLKGKSVTDLEIEFGVLASKEQLVRSAFYFREPLPYDKFSQERAALFSDGHNPELSEKEKEERKTALDGLKEKIRTHFKKENHPEKVKTYAASWDAEREKVTGLEVFGEMVKEDILAECEDHAKETWDEAPQNWQEQELVLLDAFINHHTHVTTFITEKGEEQVPTFCGRQPLLEELRKHLFSADAEKWGLVLTGESGSGKSAVFSMMHKMMEKEECLILAHSAGLSPRAKHVADLLKVWNNLLRKELGMEQVMEETPKENPLKSGLATEQEKTPETPIEVLQQQFAELLSMATKNKRVVLLIDALDRFEPTGRAKAMSWLPALIPRNVRLLCTAITGTEKEAVKYHRGLQTKSIDIFTPEEAKEMLNALSRRNHKTLPASIAKLILEKKTHAGLPSATSPLWLSLAVNILMAIDRDDFEKMSRIEGRGDQQIETYLTNLARGFDPVPGKLFLSLIEKACILFGEDFTRAVFDYIAVSRNGLREKDLEALLPAGGIAWDPLRYAMLRRWFRAHLVMQGEELQWNLAHSILRESLKEGLFEIEHNKLNQNIANHFLEMNETDPLHCSETMFHLIESGDLYKASLYYGGDLNKNEESGATNILAEISTSGEDGLKIVTELPKIAQKNNEIFNSLFGKYVYSLNKALSVENNLNERATLLNYFIEMFQKNDIKTHKRDFWWMHTYISLYDSFGFIQQERGNKIEAIKFFERSLELAKELHNEYPDIWLTEHNIAVSYGKLGNLLREMGQFEDSLKHFENYLKIHEKLYEENPNDDMKYGIAISYEKLGEINQAMGNLKEALIYYEKDLKLSNELNNDYPSNELFKYGLAISYSKLADLYSELGKHEKAIQFFILDINLINELYKNNPININFKYSYIIANEKIGFIHKKLSNMEEALKYYENIIQFIEEENNIYLRIKYAYEQFTTYGKIGSIYQSLYRFEEAMDNFQKYHQIANQLCNRNPKNSDYKGELSISYLKLGEVHQLLGNSQKALANYKLFYETGYELFQGDKNLEKLYETFALFNYKLAKLYKQIGENKKGVQYWIEFKIFVSNLIHINPQESKYIIWDKSKY